MISIARRLGRSAFGIGMALGLILNLSMVPLTRAASARAALARSGCDTAVALPAADQTDDLWTIQAAAYQALFGMVMQKTSRFYLSTPVTGDGAYSGMNEYGAAWTLLAAYTWQVDPNDPAAGLSSQQLAQWTGIGMTAFFFTGVMKSTLNQTPVFGVAFSYQHAGAPRVSEVVVLSGMDPGLACPMARSVLGISTDQESTACMARLQACQDSFDANMRLATSTLKACMALFGTACVVSAILTGAFCLVNPAVCVGGGALTKWLCGSAAACVAAYLVAIVALQIDYEACIQAALAHPDCAGVMILPIE